MPRSTLLTFHMDEARLAKVRFTCMKCGILLKPVPEGDMHRPIGALCGLAVPDNAESAEPSPFADEMAVFCHMDNQQVNRFLTAARQMRLAPIALKAVLTPTNAAWTPADLHAELTAERQAILQGRTADHTPEE